MKKNQSNKKEFGDKKYSSNVMNGSMTLEAAMVLPVYITTIFCFIYFIIIINYQNIMQNGVDNAAKAIGRYSYVINRIDGIEGNVLNDSGLEMDNDILILGISTAYAWKKILTDEVKKYSETVNVYKGVNGISIVDSVINNEEDGIHDIQVNYRISTNILGGSVHSFRLSNRCYFHSWIGTSIVQKSTDNHNQIVYITRTGDVYHLTDTCTYLDISVIEERFSNVSNLRNDKGAKYKACAACVSDDIEENDIIYVTTSGTRYHSDSACSKINRNVISIDISDVGDRKLCSRCENK